MDPQPRYTTIQVSSEFRDKLRRICNDKHITYEELFKYALECYEMLAENKLIGEDGNPKAVILSDEDLHAVGEIAKKTGLTKSEVVSHLIRTLKFIFEERLTLADIVAILIRERKDSYKKSQSLAPQSQRQ